jgi:hypothetical protein
MSKQLTRKITDYSDEKSFAFSFFCDICGKEWKSPATSFETGGVTIAHEEARTLLWSKEHGAAFEQANLDARLHFSLCTVCGKRVCDGCFNMEENQHGDVCKECDQGSR